MNEEEAVEFLLNFISVCNCMVSEDYRIAFEAVKVLEDIIVVCKR